MVILGAALGFVTTALITLGLTTFATAGALADGAGSGFQTGFGPKTAGFNVACGADGTASMVVVCDAGAGTARIIEVPAADALAAAATDESAAVEAAPGIDAAAPTEPTGIVMTKSKRNRIAAPRDWRRRARRDERRDGVSPSRAWSGVRPAVIG